MLVRGRLGRLRALARHVEGELAVARRDRDVPSHWQERLGGLELLARRLADELDGIWREDAPARRAARK